MPISQVFLSNTFNQFRTTFNDAANAINGLQSGTENSNVSSLTAVTANITTGNITTGNVSSLTAVTANITTGNITTANVSSLTVSTLPSGSIVLVGSNGLITTDADITFNTSNNTLTVANLVVSGTQTIINTDHLTIEDKNIVLANTSSPSDVLADGGGLTLKGTTDKTFNWVDSTDSWTSSEHLDIATGKSFKINGTNVLSATQLGTGVTNSSLTSVGTIASGTWQGNSISTTYTDAKVVSIVTSGGLISANSSTGVVSLSASANTATTGKAIAMAIVFGS